MNKEVVTNRYTTEEHITDNAGDTAVYTEPRIGAIVRDTVLGLAVAATLLSSIYTVEEGHVAVVKRFSEAKYQVEPGLHFKAPIVDSLESMEVRTRKNVEEHIPVATAEQMPSHATVSVNWTVNRAEAIDIFKQYGGLDQFESRILDPKIKSGSKEAISKHTAEEIIRNRNVVITKIQDAIITAMEPYPIVINSVQLENITFPMTYTNAIEAKQVALQEAVKEEHKLERQRLEAQRQVNTAEAEKQSRMKAADGVAYQTETEAKAEAEAIRLIGIANAGKIQAMATALATNPQVIEYEQVKRWQGNVPTTVMGNGQSIMWQMKGTK
jgi:regulator of protease activity HflC (stomatin/prohibitin superfamily)